MRKYFVSIVCALALIVVTNCAQAQSLKGKVWQSQDSNDFRYEPSTIVANTDGTFNYIEYRFVKNELYSNSAMFYEGKFTETKGWLSLSIYKGGRSVFVKSYSIRWINSSEFILTEGIKKHHYVELGTTADLFTPKYLVPYLQNKVDNSEPVDACYSELVDGIKANKLASNQSRSSKVASGYEMPKKKLEESDEIGEFYSTVLGKVFTLKHANYTVTFEFKDDSTYNYIVNQRLTDHEYILEQSGQYTQVKDSIVFTPKKQVEKNLFEGGGGSIQPTVGITGNSTITHKIIWVNDYMFRMKFNNVKRLFVVM